MDLFELGRSCFEAFKDELASYGIPVDPRMELRQGKGMLCYYDTADGHVYLSVPDLSTAMGKLNLMLLRTYLRASSDEELLRFFRQFIPRLVAHEMAHHLRHKHGRFGDNLWEEEQVANQLAVAMTRHRLTPDERAFAIEFLRRALEGLAEKVGPEDIALLSYHNVLEALNASGKMSDDAVEQIEVTQKLFSTFSLEEIAEADPELSRRREEIIREINTSYASDYVRYMYYHAGWLYVDLTSHGAEYVDEFARDHLGVVTPLLPAIDAEGVLPSDTAILACFLASREAVTVSEAASRWFYKRYRSMLWARIQATQTGGTAHRPLQRTEAQFFLENWSEGVSDAIDYVSGIAPPELRDLFPERIARLSTARLDVAASLPTETDRRLYRHVLRHEPDAAAENTHARLALLEQTDVFRTVPAEPLLEVCRSLCLVRLAKGETIIWEGEMNDDVFFLTRGRLDVFVTERGTEKRVGAILPGEVFGEMAFFSRDVRNATARAAVPSDCFVIKDSDLLLLSFRHPSIPMQMAGALTRRLAGSNRRAAPVRSTYDPSLSLRVTEALSRPPPSPPPHDSTSE